MLVLAGLSVAKIEARSGPAGVDVAGDALDSTLPSHTKQAVIRDRHSLSILLLLRCLDAQELLYFGRKLPHCRRRGRDRASAGSVGAWRVEWDRTERRA